MYYQTTIWQSLNLGLKLQRTRKITSIEYLHINKRPLGLFIYEGKTQNKKFPQNRISKITLGLFKNITHIYN